MPSVKYTYTISSTCPHGVNIDALSYDIRSSDIIHALHYVYVDDSDDRVDVWFRDTIDSTDQSKLVELLNNHSGMPLPFSTTVSGTDSDFSRNLIINNEGDGIGISQQMPFHVTTVSVAAPHDLFSESHTGVLNDIQIPSFITRDSELINASGILNFKIDNLDFYTTNEVDTIVSGLAAWDHNHDLRYIQIENQIVIDHGSIDGLGDDDHPQYILHTEFTTYSGTLQNQIDGKAPTIHSHNDLYFTEAEITTISGNIISQIITDHGDLSGRNDDDHTQYLLADGTRQLSGDWNFGSAAISGTGNILASMFTGGYIDLNNLVNPPHREGRLFWDNANHALAVYNEVDGITQQVGQESYVRVYNSKGYTIPNGSVVTVEGSFNENPTVHLSIASHLEHQDLGLCTNDILPGEIGYITTFGLVHDLNTSAFQPGEVVYTSATVSGGLTNVSPAAPNRVTEIGWAITAHATEGIVLVNVKKSASLRNLSDVDADNPADGDIISYNDLTKTWKAIARNSHAHTAEQISFAVDNFYVAAEGIQNNVDYALQEQFESIYIVGGTGRTTPEVVAAATGTFEVTVYSGSGYIFKEDKIWEVTWSGSIVNTLGYAEGYYWVYADIDNQVHVTNVETDPLTVIRIASFYTAGLGVVSVMSVSGFWYDNVITRLALYMRHMGAFIYDDGGTVLPRAEDLFTIRSTACKVQNLFRELQLTEVSSLDTPTRFNTWFKTVDGWVIDDYMLYSDGGRIPVDRYNNVTGSGIRVLPYNCTTTSGSSVVTSSGNLTSYLSYGDLIYKTSDTIFSSALVSGVSWNGSQSTVNLIRPYIGAGGTGTTSYINALDAIPSGKWVKHLIIRTFDDRMHFVYSQGYYDSEQEALDGGYPELPEALGQRSLNMASIVVSTDTTSLVGKIHDIRPLPFYDREGGKQTGGTASTHGDLSGLDADDHLQYLTETRGDGRYYTKTLLNAGQLDSRYYTESEINAIDTAISGALQSQIDGKSPLGHLHDDRYYTETELNAGQLNNLYYTESEVNTLLSAKEPTISPKNTAFNVNFGSTAGTVASGNHVHAQLHDRQHAVTSTADHTAGNNKVFYSNNSGVITELPLGASGTILMSNGSAVAPKFDTGSNIFDYFLATSCASIGSDFYTTPATTWLDVPLATIQYQNNTAIVERHPTTTDRITIKLAGVYLIQYCIPVYCPVVERVDVRVRVNDNTVISGSVSYLNDSMTQQVANQFSTYLNTNDFITLQTMGATTGDYLAGTGTINIVRLTASKGDAGAQGLPGTGSNVNVLSGGTAVSGTPFGNLNFQGFTAVSGATNTANIENVFGSYFQEASAEADDSTTVVWAASPKNPRVTITTPTLPSGKYRIGWSYNLYCASTSVSPQARVQINDTDTIHAYLQETSDATANEQAAVSGFYYLASSGIKTIDLDYGPEVAGTSVTIRRARLEFWRVS